MKAVTAASIVNGKTYGMNDMLVFTGVSTDTRNIKKGDMFIAIKGDNFDGAEYINKAFENGASCIITSKVSSDSRIITVDDPVLALGKLAKYNRNKFGIPVIAVTGSVGKTTVKNMLTAIFSQKYNVLSTFGNKNNHIGLPMTLMLMDESHEIAIIEMGMNDFGEIDYLSKIAQPDYAVITNIGMAHIGKLGSMENILKAKSEVVNNIKPGGSLLINGDDDLLSGMDVKTGLNLIRFGVGRSNDYFAEEIETNSLGNCTFASRKTFFRLPVAGAYNAANAMAAIALGRIFKISEKLIRKGLSEFDQPDMRMQRYSFKEINYINDAYNANPRSMKAALDILKRTEGRRIAVLGDMLEMGEFSKDKHVEIGKYAAMSADILLLCGDEATNMAAGASASPKNVEIHMFKNLKTAESFLRSIVRKKDTVLVKGSRGMKMENVLRYTVDGGQK